MVIMGNVLTTQDGEASKTIQNSEIALLKIEQVMKIKDRRNPVQHCNTGMAPLTPLCPPLPERLEY